MTPSNGKIANDKIKLIQNPEANKQVLIKQCAQTCPIRDNKLANIEANVVYSLRNKKFREQITAHAKICIKCNRYFATLDILDELPNGIKESQIKITTLKTKVPKFKAVPPKIPLNNSLVTNYITCGDPKIFRGLYCRFHYNEEHYNSK